MNDYPRGVADRAALRGRIGEAGRRQAIAMRLSLKCEGVQVVAQHADQSDGCKNDGSGCLCECHDPLP